MTYTRLPLAIVAEAAMYSAMTQVCPNLPRRA